MSDGGRGPWLALLGFVVGVAVTLAVVFVTVQILDDEDPGEAGATTTTVPTTSTSSTLVPATVTTTTMRLPRTCDQTVGPGADLATIVAEAADDTTICLESGSYGSMIIDVERSGFVTVASETPLGAHFELIGFDGAAYVRIEEVTVVGPVANGEDASHHIEIAGSDLEGVFIDAPRLEASAEGPSDWLIEFNDIHNCSSFCVALLSADPTRQAPISDVVIRGNRLGPMGTGEDAIRLHNWRDVIIEDNEILGVIENGQHNDCLQSVWGGDGLIFRRNYLHDNNCQTFFIKDGYATNVLFEDNLSLRNRAGGAPVSGQVYPTGGFTMTRNTLWDSASFYFRSSPHGARFPGGEPADYAVSGNVILDFIPLDDENGGAGAWPSSGVISEDFNVFGGGWTWVPSHMGQHSDEDSSPDFVEPTENAADDLAFGDWRLAGEVEGGGDTYEAGITWLLAGREFGIAAFR